MLVSIHAPIKMWDMQVSLLTHSVREEIRGLFSLGGKRQCSEIAWRYPPRAKAQGFFEKSKCSILNLGSHTVVMVDKDSETHVPPSVMSLCHQLPLSALVAFRI